MFGRSRTSERALRQRRRVHRTLRSELLEKRQLLAADLAGDDLATAQAIELSQGVVQQSEATIGDGLHDQADVDLYSVDLAAGQTLHADIDAGYRDDGAWLSDLDSYLRIFDSGGNDVIDGPSDL